MSLRAFIMAATLAVSVATPARADLLFFQDFDSPVTVGLGASVAFSDAGATFASTTAPYLATYGNIFRNSTTGLSEVLLSGLPAHSSLSFSGILAFLDSWDSRDGSPAPDNLDLFIDGALVHSYTYNNASGSVKDIGTGSLVAEYVQFDSNFFYSDTVVSIAGLIVPHTGSTLTIGFQASGAGWQGGTDEAWGIDNIRVDIFKPRVVPEPSTFALVLAGLAGVGAAARRRK